MKNEATVVLWNGPKKVTYVFEPYSGIDFTANRHSGFSSYEISFHTTGVTTSEDWVVNEDVLLETMKKYAISTYSGPTLDYDAIIRELYKGAPDDKIDEALELGRSLAERATVKVSYDVTFEPKYTDGSDYDYWTDEY